LFPLKLFKYFQEALVPLLLIPTAAPIILV